MSLCDLRLLVSIEACGSGHKLILASLVTHPTSFSDSRHNLAINCVVFGDDRSHVFTIEIDDTKNVSTLKKAIKDEKKHTFRDVDADSLVLWKVSFAVDESLNENLNDLDLGAITPLPPLDELSEVFSDLLARKHLHILVQPPPNSE